MSLLVAIAAAGIMALVGFIIRGRLDDLLVMSDRVTHSHNVIAQLNAITTDLAQLEAAQRGYQLTGQAEYRSQHQSARQSLETRLSQLRDASRDNPAGLANLDTLGDLIDERLRISADIVTRKDAGDDDGAKAITAEGQSIELGRRIGGVIGGMVAAEETLKTGRRDELIRQGNATRHAVMSLIFGLIPVLVVGFVAVLHELYKRRQAVRSLHDMSVHDSLTGLSNRREFDRRLAEVCRADSAALLLLDIDHFKKINDTHGHQVGDAVLRWIGGALRRSAREGDTVARVGGEEFAVLIPDTTVEIAASVAERLRASVAGATLHVDASGGGQIALNITISVGWAHEAGPCHPSELFARGDRALYQAKAEGRNRVVAAA